MTERPQHTAASTAARPGAPRPSRLSLSRLSLSRLSLSRLSLSRLSLSVAASLCLCFSVAQQLLAQPADSPDRARIERQPVSVVLINNSASDAIKMLSAAAGGVPIKFGPGVNVKALRPLTISAREVPFYQVLAQIAMIEDLVVNPAQAGFTLTRAPLAQPMSLASPPMAHFNAVPGAAGGYTGMSAAVIPLPDESAFSQLNGPVQLNTPGPINGPGAINVPQMSSGPEQDSGMGSRATGLVLQYVLNYARNPHPGMARPEQIFPFLNSRDGALEYIAVVTEALTDLTLPPVQAQATAIAEALPAAPPVGPPAPGPAAASRSVGPPTGTGAAFSGRPTGAPPAPQAAPAVAADPVSRLRVLLGEAEGLYDRISRKERLEVEIEVLSVRVARADPSIQPFLNRVLQSRRQALADLGR